MAGCVEEPTEINRSTRSGEKNAHCRRKLLIAWPGVIPGDQIYDIVAGLHDEFRVEASFCIVAAFAEGENVAASDSGARWCALGICESVHSFFIADAAPMNNCMEAVSFPSAPSAMTAPQTNVPGRSASTSPWS